MRLVHLADIHVKDRRRNEYQAVFRALVSQIRAERPLPDVVVIAGDVFDTMSRASAHNWEDVATLLNSLADVAPVALIPGNHDLNVRAEKAPDLIRPMLTAAGGARRLQPPRVTYWRDSGVYAHAGGVWAVSVPGQPPFALEDVAAALAAAPPGAPLVGLYHESVGGACYPNGLKVETAVLGKNDLGALCAAAGAGRPLAILLGDIHLRQEVPFGGSGPAAAAWYPGSLVCQNFGEPHLGHGYLLWDLTPGAAPRVRVTPRDVPNPRAPLTLRLGPAGEDLTPEPRPERPRAYRVVHAPEAPAGAVEAAVAAAATRFGFAPRSVEAAARPPEGPAPALLPPAAGGAALAAAGDWARHAAFARALLSEAQTPPATAEAALALYEEAAVAASRGGSGAAPKAELVRLEFENMFCYGPGNVVDFDALRRGRPGLVGFVAPNRAGKSSLFDILTFAFCDEVPRGDKQDVPRQGGPGYRLRLAFRVDGKEGRLEKTGSRGGLVRAHSTIRLWVGGEDLTADTAPETAALARKLLGVRRWLDSVTFLRPAEVSGVAPFVLASAAERRETLSALLDLAAFKDLEKSVEREVSELRGERRALLRRWPEGSGWKEGEAAAPLADAATVLKTAAAEMAAARAAAEAELGAAEERARTARDAAERVAHAVASAAALARSASRAQDAAAEAAADAADAAAALAGLEAAAETLVHAQDQLAASEAELIPAGSDSEEAQSRLREARAACDVSGARALDARARILACARRAADAHQKTQASPAGAPPETVYALARGPPAAETDDGLGAALDALETACKAPDHLERAASEAAAGFAAQAENLRRRAAALGAACAEQAVPAGGLREGFPATDGPAGVVRAAGLERVLAELKEARLTSEVHAGLRAKVGDKLRPGCPGCAATEFALGGQIAARAAALAAQAAGLAPPTLAKLAHDARALETEAASAESKVTSRSTLRAERLEAADKSLAVAEKALGIEEREVSRLTGEAALAETLLRDAEVRNAQARDRVSDARVAAARVDPARSRASRAQDALATAKAEEARALAEAARAAEAAAQAEAVQNEAYGAQKDESVARSALALATAACERAKSDCDLHESAAAEALKVDTALAVRAAFRKLLHPRNGVGARLLAGAVVEVGAEISAALKEMDASFGISFTEDLELVLVDKASGVRTPAALGSGYQQFVSALAVRWALAKIARTPLPACFMIDEGFGCLDDQNLQRVAEALKTLAMRASVGRARPLVLAVTHREDMAPYFAERLGIVVDAGGISKVAYPPGATSDLATLVPASHPPRWCEACRVEVAAASWTAHVRTARHRQLAVGGQPAEGGVGPFFCRVCDREVPPGRWSSHDGTAAHMKAATAQAARDEVVAAFPGVAGPAGCLVVCLLCPDSPSFTPNRWARHVASTKHCAHAGH